MPRKKIHPAVYPSTITCLNLICGLASIALALYGDFFASALMLVVCFALDGCDGRMARRWNATSEFGSELDTLSDTVSFGVAPFIFVIAQYDFNSALLVSGMFFVLCGVLRLVRYSVFDFELDGFRGMPITTNGIIFFVLYLLHARIAVFIGAFIILGLLMISTIRVPHPLKKHQKEE